MPPDSIFDDLPKRALLRVNEVAFFFAVTQKTVYRWYAMEKLKGTNVNGVLRIYRQSVIDLVKDNHGRKNTDVADDADAVPKMEGFRKIRGNWVKGY